MAARGGLVENRHDGWGGESKHLVIQQGVETNEIHLKIVEWIPEMMV